MEIEKMRNNLRLSRLDVDQRELTKFWIVVLPIRQRFCLPEINDLKSCESRWLDNGSKLCKVKARLSSVGRSIQPYRRLLKS